MKRRHFLGLTAAGAGSLFLMRTAPRALAAETPAGHYDPFEMVELGKTGLKFSRTMIGTGVKGGMRQTNLTRMGMEKAKILLRGAFDKGIRAFDLADMYGTHPYAAAALKGLPRAEYRIVSKIWFRSGGIPEKERPDADIVVSRFLKELETDHIDLVLMHCVTSEKWPDEIRRQMDILSKLKEKGVVRAVGVSCHSLPALSVAAREPWVDSIHARINPFGVKMDAPADQVLPVLKQIKAAGKGLVGMKIYGEGDFRSDPGKREQSLRYTLHEAKADVLLIGFESLDEIDDHAARVRAIPKPG